ncbi:sulfatase-like hydrolase/transferase [Persicirhabdus sediminis]|uniref:Sulfatase-like hydrolase/transferase n=1 Tax=Persicirhabdus sediminis TaxID=454144 RepID=A0A8J7MCY6_9BACT|nr:sulfatase-like hydrolase/transferase [Persicirhabdus sediminis]MBK1790887.1 sulfatase-like hydrolase/transferase [Persicirhabdus sediminis]
MKPTRYRTLKTARQLATALALSSLPVLSASTSAAAEKPNFIWIVADDLGYGDTGFNGSTEIPTPNIDRIANDGVNMTCAYVSAPVCGPSRAGYHTGRYQQSFGHEGNVGGSDKNNGTPTDVIMIQEYLQTLGYHTGLMGKWHDGKAQKFFPYNRGFDEFFGFNNGASSYWIKNNPKKMLLRNDQPVESENEYLTDAIGREAVDFINRNHDKPFFLEVAFNAPHAPMSAKDEDLELFKDLGHRQTIAAMIHCMDVNIGKILDALETHNIADNTMVVVFSDNGGKLEHGGTNGHLRGEKAGTYEGGMRVPFAAKLTGTIPAGSKSDVPIISLDLFPTIALLAGGEIKDEWKLDGKNIIDVLSSKSQKPPHQTFFWRYGPSWAIRHGDMKLVRALTGEPIGLFNLAKDPSEKNNLIEQNPEVAETLRKQWNDTSREIGPPAWGRFKGKIERD